MMLTRRTAVLSALAGVASCTTPSASAGVVASFSIIGDLAREVLGDLVPVRVLVGADADSHVYEPTPADAVTLSKAELLIENGLNFEPWLARLKEAGGFTGISCVAAAGIDPLRIGAAADPHAWHDVANARRYVASIAEAATRWAPEHRDTIRSRSNNLNDRLADLDAIIRARLAKIPQTDRVVVTSHDAFGYFGRAYGVRFLAPLGFSTDMEPRPDRVAQLVDQIRQERVRALFLENMTDPRLLQAIANETGVRIGGTLYSDALSSPDGPAPTYEAFMRHNLEHIAAALD